MRKFFLTWNLADQPPYQAQPLLLAHTSTPFSYLSIVSAESNPPLSLVVTLGGIPMRKCNPCQILLSPLYKTVEHSRRLVAGSRYYSCRSM